MKIMLQMALLGEAYFHRDGSNFLFVLVRKGTLLFRIKVNKITSLTSKEAFMEISRLLADSGKGK